MSPPSPPVLRDLARLKRDEISRRGEKLSRREL